MQYWEWSGTRDRLGRAITSSRSMLKIDIIIAAQERTPFFTGGENTTANSPTQCWRGFEKQLLHTCLPKIAVGAKIRGSTRE